MTQPHEHPEAPEPLGSLVEEAAKLVAAVSTWAREQGVDAGSGVSGLVDQALRAARGWHLDLAQTWAAETGATGSGQPLAEESTAEHADHAASGSCAWCPWCRGVDVLRTAYQGNPEVREQVGLAISTVVTAVTEFLAGQQAAAPPPAAAPASDDDVAGGER